MVNFAAPPLFLRFRFVRRSVRSLKIYVISLLVWYDKSLRVYPSHCNFWRDRSHPLVLVPFLGGTYTGRFA